MDFSVNARAVAGLADALDFRAHDLTTSASYLQAHSSLAFGAGLINEMCQTHEHVMATVEAFLRRAGNDYAAVYSRGVTQAVRAYTSTDAAASARLDATLPGVVDPSVASHVADQSLGPEIFADPSCLTLQTPPDFETVYPYQPEWADLASPTTIARDVVWKVTSWLHQLGLLPEACDPYQTFTRPICGDWAGLEKTSFALTVVASALRYVSTRVTVEARTLDEVWTGNAAGNCRSALERFAHDLLEAEQLVIEIAQDYHAVAEEARKQGEALGTAVSALVDLCATLGAELGVELAMSAAGDVTRLEEIGEAIGTLLSNGRTILEMLHTVIEAERGHVDELCIRMALLTPHPFTVDLPDDYPVLPAPAHR